MKNNRGIIKIKLLAIIGMIGVIAILCIPKLVNYIEYNKKERYISIAKEYVEEVRSKINIMEYKQIPINNQALLVPLSNLNLKKSSPYGSFKSGYSYVIVVPKNSYYEYYFASIDSSKHGIPIVNEKELNVDSVIFGESNLTNINRLPNIDNLYIDGTIYKKSEDTKEDDNNILLTPVSGDLTVSYDFKAEVHKIYDELIKNIDTEIYNKEATINNGVLKYNNKVLSSDYSKDVNGVLRYLSFPNNDGLDYYSSYVIYNKSYVAGVINKSGNYSSKNITFDSVPAIVINEDANIVEDNNKKYLMWNLMAIYPNNDNYIIDECGAIILQDNNATSVNLTLTTPNAVVGKSNNNCELGNIFAIRKDNIKNNDHFFARGYIKYHDKSGNSFTSYSNTTISALVR